MTVIIAIAVGGGAFVLGVVVACICLAKRRKSRSTPLSKDAGFQMNSMAPANKSEQRKQEAASPPSPWDGDLYAVNGAPNPPGQAWMETYDTIDNGPVLAAESLQQPMTYDTVEGPAATAYDTVQGSASSVRLCGYVSPGGRSCKTITDEQARYCPAHLCPICEERPRSSRETQCHSCAAGRDASLFATAQPGSAAPVPAYARAEPARNDPVYAMADESPAGSPWGFYATADAHDQPSGSMERRDTVYELADGDSGPVYSSADPVRGQPVDRLANAGPATDGLYDLASAGQPVILRQPLYHMAEGSPLDDVAV